MSSLAIIQILWNNCNVLPESELAKINLCDDGMSYWNKEA